jgi:hypothetical protein
MERFLLDSTGFGTFYFSRNNKIPRFFFFYSTSSTGRLAFLNNLMAVFEYQVNEVGNTSANELRMELLMLN